MDRWQSLSRTGKLLVTAAVLVLGCGTCGWLGSLSQDSDGVAVSEPSADGAASLAQESRSESGPAPAEPTERHAAPTERPVEPTEPSLPAIGDTVPLGKTRWKVDIAEDLGATVPSGNQFIDDLQTNGKFVRIGLIFANDDTDAMFVPEPAIVDDRDRVFEPASDAFMVIDSSVSCVLEQVNPGLTKDCLWIYELPADATGLKLRVKSASFFADTTDIDLDL